MIFCSCFDCCGGFDSLDLLCSVCCFVGFGICWNTVGFEWVILPNLACGFWFLIRHELLGFD